MSRSKDRFGGERGRLIRVTTRCRCPVCSGPKACSVSADGARVLCTQVENGKRYDRGAVPFWIHYLTPDRAASFVASAPPGPPESERGDIHLLDYSYRALLAELSLSSAHEEHLVNVRKLNRDQIRMCMFRTWPLEGRARIAKRWVERVGESVARKTPGYRLATDGDCSWATLAGPPGIVAPCFDTGARIGALKNRSDEPRDGQRYRWISSSGHGGPKAMHMVSVTTLECDRGAVVVTEGELKATIITALSGALAISVPGVSSWPTALPVLREIGPAKVFVAFDMDYLEKPDVAAARRDLVRALKREGFAFETLSWDPAHKGFDDYLIARARATEAA